jgi:hypothetical protein
MVRERTALVQYARSIDKELAMRASLWLSVAFFILPSTHLTAAEPPPAQWIVVTAPAYRKAVEPLCDHRKAQGMHVTVIETTEVVSKKRLLAGDTQTLREHISKLAREAKGPSYVLLVGAVEANSLDDAEAKVLPPLRGTTGRMKGQPSDNGYGCFDKELLPTAPVGRFPARSVEEAKKMVEKTLAYEKDAKPGEWRRRLTVLAGAPAFNPAVDKLVEELAIARLAKLDPSWSGRAIYANAQSRFCLPDDLLRKKAISYVEEGQALILYLGHSSAEGFAAGPDGYMNRDDWAKVDMKRGPGIFATFGCNGCQLTDADHHEGYGIAAMRNPHGPVAVLGSHGICFAAMVQLASDGLFQSLCGAKPPERLGDAWLRLKESLAKGKIDAISFWLLDKADGDPNIPQATQRLEHLEMFVLLGDPALRLPVIPGDVKLTVAGSAQMGGTITVTGEAPDRLAGAKVRLTLERPLTSEPADLQPLPEKKDERAQVMLGNHERANRFVLAERETTVADGRFEVKLAIPDKAPWSRLLIRAYAATDRYDGCGVLALDLKTNNK